MTDLIDCLAAAAHDVSASKVTFFLLAEKNYSPAHSQQKAVVGARRRSQTNVRKQPDHKERWCRRPACEKVLLTTDCLTVGIGVVSERFLWNFSDGVGLLSY